jgi:hypothetical protein
MISRKVLKKWRWLQQLDKYKRSHEAFRRDPSGTWYLVIDRAFPGIPPVFKKRKP